MGTLGSGTTPASAAPPPSYGFTLPQLHTLRNQIIAFRLIKKSEAPLPPDIMNGIQPPTLPLRPSAADAKKAAAMVANQVKNKVCHDS